MLVRVFAVLSLVAITCLPLTGCTGDTAPAGGGGSDVTSEGDDSNTTTN